MRQGREFPEVQLTFRTFAARETPGSLKHIHWFSNPRALVPLPGLLAI
jgi:hypothetical protein